MNRCMHCQNSVWAGSTQRYYAVGMEMPPILSDGGVSSEEDTAVKVWADQLAGDPFAGDLDSGCGDEMKWLGTVSDNIPQRFIELRRAKADKKTGTWGCPQIVDT